ncbi:hypothetical protein ACYCAX_11825 [Pseudomonas sp. MT3]
MSLQTCEKSAGAAIFGRYSRKVQVAQVLWVLVALAGCAGQVELEPRTVRVEVPVAVPCRAPAVEVPTWATASLQKVDTLQTKVRALLAELEQRKGYEVQLRAAVRSCQ